MKTFVKLFPELLLAGLILAGCDAATPTETRTTAVGTFEINLAPLTTAITAGSQQSICVSAVESAELSVSQGRPREHRIALEPGDDFVHFSPVVVAIGTSTFRAIVRSNNGSILYDGEVREQIEEDDFYVMIPLTKRNPVLQVCPSVQLWRSESVGTYCAAGSLSIANRGTGTLQWWVESPFATSGRTNAGSASVVGFEHCWSGSNTLPVTVHSEHGDAELVLRVN